jgi:ankyrin repeat protein
MCVKRLAPWTMVVFLAVVSLGAGGSDLRLIEAAKKPDSVAVRALLKQKVDVNAREGDGATALHWAAHWDDLETAGLLIAAGANVNAADENGGTPLWVACTDAGPAMVDRLLKAGANPNLAPLSGATPLMAATRAGNLDAVKALLVHGADVNAAEHGREQTALMWATAERHPKVVEALVEAGAHINARSGVRPLVVNTGAEYETKGVIEIQQGGYTPLLFAAQQGDIASARFLLAAGANVNDVAPAGVSALVLAAHSGQEEFGIFLVDKGADPNAAGAGYTALDAAILRREGKLVKALLAHGANPNAPLLKATPARRASVDYALGPQMVGATPFWLAARYAEPDAMRALAAGGADTRFVVQDGTTALMAPLTVRIFGADDDGATGGGPPLTERMILDAMTAAAELGVDLNASNTTGATALHLAVAKEFTTVVQFLAGKGADLNVKDKKGRTPLASALASKTGASMADLLRKLGATE